MRLERVRQRRRGYGIWRLVRASIWDFGLLVRESWVALTGFSLVSAVNTIYLLYGYHDYANAGVPPFTFPAALFETLRMLVLQSGLPLPVDDPIGMLLFFITPLLGLALIFQSVLNFGRLLLDKGSRREAWQVALATTFRNHTIVCGLGRVSYRVMLQLLEIGQEVVVVERDWNSEFVPIALRLKVPVVLGDARDPDILRQAGLRHARGLLAGINDDLLNVEIALVARRKRPDMQVVMRIFNQELDTNLERSFGRNSAFSSSALAAPTMAAAAISQSLIHVLPLHDGLLGVAEITLADESQVCGFRRGIEDRFDIRILRHRDATGREQKPGLMQKLEGGDVLLLLGSLDALERVRLQNQPGNKLDFLQPIPSQRPTARFNAVIVCGLGKIGYRVVKVLHATQPRPEIVVVCTDNTSSRFVEDVRALGIRVVVGDAREADVLAEAGIAQAYAVAAVVGNDLTNLQIGMTARRLRGDIHLVLRVFSDVLAERLATLFGIYTTFSASALAAPTLAAATVVREIDYAIDIGERLFATATVRVETGDVFAGKTVEQVRDHANILVIAVRRDGVRMAALKLDTMLYEGDELVVLLNVTARGVPRWQSSRTPEVVAQGRSEGVKG